MRRIRSRVGWPIVIAALLLLAGAVARRPGWAVDAPALIPPAPLASSGGLWQLSFDDEFDGSGLDPARWSNGFGWGNSAANFAGFCDPAANVVAGGVLVQRADARPQGGKPYSAACIHTKGKFSQLYGYWEARMRVASGRGVHSAFWGKPANEEWPPELDVEEISGGLPSTVIMSAHWRDQTGPRMSHQTFDGPDFTAGYHVFGAEWTPTETIWYVDGIERARIPDGAASMQAKGPFYVLLDLQVGLGGGPLPDATTTWPATQLVDYVRIWTRPLPTPPSATARLVSAGRVSP